MSRLARATLLLPLVSLLLACGTDERLGSACPDPGAGAGGMLLWDGVESFVPGTTIPLVPLHATMPGSVEALDPGCLRDVEVVPPDAGQIVREDGLVALRVAGDAPLGEVFRVRARYREQSLSGRFSVFDPELSPLVGYWRQDPTGCAPGSDIRELVFSADGTFSVTWEPFEAYKDYWGNWHYDTASGWLELTLVSGNREEPGLRSGTVVVDGTGMALVSASFGRRRDDVPECRGPFPR